MNLEKKIIESKSIYSKEWNNTSEFYFKKGYYELLTSKLPNKVTNLIEIGSGNGHSTLALTKIASRILSVDENSFCVINTHALLKRHNMNAIKTIRGEIKSNFQSIDNFYYEMVYEKHIENLNYNIHCIEGNILTDQKLIDYIVSHNSIDVVTCWLIGAHGFILNEKQQKLKGRCSQKRTSEMLQGYKLEVIEQAARIFSLVANENSILSVVERINNKLLKQFNSKDILNLYNEKIVPFGLKQTNNFDITKIDTISEIKMISNQGIVDNDDIVLLYLEYKKT